MGLQIPVSTIIHKNKTNNHEDIYIYSQSGKKNHSKPSRRRQQRDCVSAEQQQCLVSIMEFHAMIETDDDGSVDPTTTSGGTQSITLGKKKKSKKKKKGAINPNTSFPFPWSLIRSQLITLQTSTEKGRYLTAKKVLTPGTILFREVPFVALLREEGSLCSTCYCQLNSSSSLVRDDLSTVDVFCSTQCRTSMHPVLMMEKDVVVGSQPGCSTLLSTIASRTSCSADLLRIVVRCLCKMAATPVNEAETIKITTTTDDKTDDNATTSCITTATIDSGIMKMEGENNIVGTEGCFIDNGDIIRATNTGVLTLEHHLGRPGTHSTAWIESVTAAFTLLLPHLHLPSPYNDVTFAIALAARINVNAYEMTTASTTTLQSSLLSSSSVINSRTAAVAQQGQCLAAHQPDLDLPPHRALGFGLFPALGMSCPNVDM